MIPSPKFTIDDLNAVEKKRFSDYHQQFSLLKTHIGKRMCVALLLFTPSILLFFCSALCLTLPGANVINEVMFNALLPATIGLLVSIALFYSLYIPAYKKRFLRDQWINDIENIINTRLIKPEKVKKNAFIEAGASFIKNNFIPFDNQSYQFAILDDLKKKYPKESADQTPDQKLIVQIFDKTKIYIVKPKINKK